MLVAFPLGFMLIPGRRLYSWGGMTVVHYEAGTTTMWIFGKQWNPCPSIGDGMSASQHTQARLAK